ncbi:MAG: succinate dehydrogenase/fumarate reductase iron-sulfur subunit [Aquificota bacterium]|nr:succinate dehydrogenase/fumarate reductase iron-sulfur subunit [Aquificota bacterium]MDQ7082630.1 succinate dehydrogenase/fumarate reductase iron-sulfur subunit [Aquificota bacterium]
MRVRLKRFREGRFFTEELEIDVPEGSTVLDLLFRIKEEVDPTLSFRSMCRASICGTCSVKVNGEPKLACNTKVKGEEITIEPVDNARPIKDLVVDQDPLFFRLRQGLIRVEPRGEEVKVYPKDLLKTERASDCILCGICDSACPSLVEDRKFGGPSLFTKAYRILEDPRNRGLEESLRRLVDFNVQSCTHCNNCNLYCPKGCMPERWITLIEGMLLKRGYIQRKTEDFGFLGF